MKYLFFIILITPLASTTRAQNAWPEQDAFFTRLSGGGMPATILNGRSVVIYDGSLTRENILAIHKSFQNSGIDAVAYFELNRIFAGKEARSKFSSYFAQREISNLIFIGNKKGYEFTITKFNGNPDFADNGQEAWVLANANLDEALRSIYRTADGAYQKKNLLINDAPETEISFSIITANRVEAFAYDMKVDPIAVPMFQDSAANRELAEIFKSYPFKYELVDPTIPEKELRRKGFFYILYYVHSTGRIAKQLLDYTSVPTETAIVSVTYPIKEPQLKNIPVNEPVYKFYVKLIESGNVYLGTKWDADTTWEQALQNYIKGLKWEMRIN